MAVSKIRGNDVSANGANIASLTTVLNTASVSLPGGQVVTKYGVLNLNSAGDLVFVPGTLSAKLGAGKKATETVKFNVQTANGSTEQVQLTYAVLGENDGPAAADDIVLLKDGKATPFNVIKNDFDIDTGDKLKVTGLDNNDVAVSQVKGGFSTATAHGVLTVSATGAVKFVADALFSKQAFTDSVTYEVSDGKGGVDVAKLDIVNNGGVAAARPSQLDLVTADDTGSATILRSTADNITSKGSVTITGVAQPGQTVTLFNNGERAVDANQNPVADIVASSTGSFSVSGVFLGVGANNITAKVSDGAVELVSSALLITRDATPPSQPVNLALAEADDTGSSSIDGFTSKTAGLTLTGTADPSTQVNIFKGTTLLGSTISDETGAFSIDVTLPAGQHMLTARAVDGAGNQSADSIAREINVVAPLPVDYKPVIAEVVAAGAASNDVTPTLQISLGLELPDGATIEVYDANVLLGKAAGSGSDFSFTPATDLAEGLHSFTARVIDVAGGKGPLSSVRALEIDITAPTAPGKLDLATPDDTGRSSTDNVTLKSSDLTLTATVASGTPASAVTLYEWDDADGNGLAEAEELTELELGDEVLSTTVSGTTFRAEVALDNGSHVLLLTQKDKAGNESLANPANAMTLVVDTAAPVAPTELDLAMDDDSGSSKTDNLTLNSQALTITGKAEALSQVELYRVVGGSEVSLGKVIASDAGTFSLDINLPEAVAGTYGVLARATDIAGNVSAAAVPLNITVDAQAPDAPVLNLLAANDHTGRLKDNANTSKTTELTFSGTTNSGSTVEVFKLDGSTLTSLGQATVTGTAFSINLDLLEGDYRLVAKATDVAGNVSAVSSAFKVVVDTTAPTAITTLNLIDADDTGASATDNITLKTSGLTVNAVVAAGTAAADVSFYEWQDINQNGVIDAPAEIRALTSQPTGGSPAEVADIAVNGTSYVANLALSEGLHQLIATQKDAAGNESALSASNMFSLLIDETAPQDAQGQDLEVFFDSATELNTSQVLIAGTVSDALESGEVLKIYNGNILLGQATVAEDNTWSFMLNKLSVVRSYTLSGQVEDVAGNATSKNGLAQVTLGTDGDDEIVGASVGKQYIFGFSGNDTITGGSGQDFISGGAGNDRIKGGDGSDKLFGGAGNDIIEGEEGDDSVFGGDGSDILRGGNGDDVLYGGAGSDRLIGGLGNDFLNGGKDADTFTGGDGSLNNSGHPITDGGNDIYQILEGDSSLPPGSTSYQSVTALVDQITDYFKGTDAIDLGGLLVDRNASAANSTYGDALSDATSELRLGADSSFQYLATTTTTQGGLFTPSTTTTTDLGVSYLFVNASGDVTPDLVIQITGINGVDGL